MLTILQSTARQSRMYQPMATALLKGPDDTITHDVDIHSTEHNISSTKVHTYTPYNYTLLQHIVCSVMDYSPLLTFQSQ